MSIRIYPSRLPGEPLETHPVSAPARLDRWLSAIAGQEVGGRAEQPIMVEINGQPISDFAVMIGPDDDVRIYPVPYGAGLAVWAAWAAVAIAAVALVYALTLNTDVDSSSQANGNKMDLNPAKANTAKLHEPVREILGMQRIYPDYLLQPVSRFTSKTAMETRMLLCVGVGDLSIPASSVSISDTPLSAFGTGANFTLYPPGADVGADARSENWFVVGEVGGTNAGTAGLDTASTAPSGTAAAADALVLSGLSVALSGGELDIPELWAAGTVVYLKTPDNYSVSRVGGYDRIAGALADLGPFVGMKVTLSAATDYSLEVASYVAGVAGVDGVGGAPSNIMASAAPSTYDFSEVTATWSVTFQGATRLVSLADYYGNMSALVNEITGQLVGMGLIAQDVSGRLRITEPASPYQGGAISQSGAPVDVFGVAETYTAGSASSGGSAPQQAFVTLRYAGGEAFTGLPLGPQRLALNYREARYKITNIDGWTITFSRLTDTGTVDAAWTGFSARSLLDFSLTSDAAGGPNWLGAFMGCPEGETATALEWDIMFPGGLTDMSYKGRMRGMTVSVELQYRDAALGGAWTSVVKTYSEATVDQIGFTHALTLPYAMRPEIRLRRMEAKYPYTDKSDAIQWYGLRARLSARPTSYPGVTLIGLTIQTGDRLSAQSDRKINLIATRNYAGSPSRSISGAALHVLDSLGIARDSVGEAQLAALEAAYWTPRGETFDLSYGSQETARDVLQSIFAAGMGHLVLSGGLVGAIREGVQVPKGAITPHEMTGELRVGFVAPSDDDYDGVDVSYISAATWAKETVECRLPGSAERKVKKITADGVTDRTRAWRIGMRALRKSQGQRLSFDCATEMDALCYEFMDRLALVDDLPGTTQSALIVDAWTEGGRMVLEVSEPLDWSVAAPRVMLRRHDGTVTALAVPVYVSEYALSVPVAAVDFELVTDLSIEPARIIFAGSTQIGYPVLVSEISPDTDGGCSVTAVEYRDDFYDSDNSAPS